MEVRYRRLVAGERRCTRLDGRGVSSSMDPARWWLSREAPCPDLRSRGRELLARASVSALVFAVQPSGSPPGERLDIPSDARMISCVAQRTVVSLIDDLDGESEADETVEYAIDGVSYEIDLSSDHAEALREVFAPYIAAARRTGGRARTGAARRRRSSSGGGAVASAAGRSRDRSRPSVSEPKATDGR